MSSTTLSTGELARRCEVNVETVRYYERRGLLAEPERSEAGRRRYSDDDARRLHFIRAAKELGFTLEEVRQLLELRATSDSARERVQAVTRDKLARIEDKLAALTRMREVLTGLLHECEDGSDIRGCPILAAMEPELR